MEIIHVFRRPFLQKSLILILPRLVLNVRTWWLQVFEPE
jgi:hypothetical protein